MNLLRFSLFTGCCAVVLIGHVRAESPETDTYTIEEDWQLILRTPDTDRSAPQFVTHFPLGGTAFIQTCWNFKDVPDFAPGGGQIQLWVGDDCLETVDITLNRLNVQDDTARWTHVYKTNGNDVSMKVVGIESQAWGTNIDTSSITKSDAEVPNFNTYNPSNSLEESHVAFGANRVAWFGITAVRKYDEQGNEISEDTTDRPVVAH